MTHTIDATASWRGLAAFALASLVAIAIGCAVAAANGVPAGVWLRNPASWVVGALMAAALAAFAGPRVTVVFLGLAPVGLVASFAAPDLQGVHRWVDLGPLHINVAEVLLPPAVAACASLAQGRVWLQVAALALALLVLQPDASQATAFGGATAVLVGASVRSMLLRIAGLAVIAVAVGASWLRPDPLAPAPEVEEIMRLAWAVSPLAAVAAWAALLASCGTLAWGRTPGAMALGVYALLTALTPILGPFPVPLVGMAMSPVLGLWLGAGLLAAQARVRGAYSPAASDA